VLSVVQGDVDSTSHALYVWDCMIEPSPASQIAIVAHSYGGVIALDMVNLTSDIAYNHRRTE